MHPNQAASFDLSTVPLVANAHIYAMAAHAAVGQKRKYTNEPYIVHPVEVACILVDAGYGDNHTLIAAALLHDVIEDTGCTFTDIHLAMGIDVAGLVHWVTNKSTEADGNRETRKRVDRENLASAPADAQTLKLADLISNTKSIVAYDPSFAQVYLKEKQALLAVLTKGDPALHAAASSLCAEGLAYLEQQRLDEVLSKG